VKIFYAIDQFSSATIQAGRIYTSGRPKMLGLFEPKDNSTVRKVPGFRWENASDSEGGGITYQLQVSRNPDFGALELNISGITGTRITSTKELTGSFFLLESARQG
jgi:hypothetical protein